MACVVEIRDREIYVLVGTGSAKKLKVSQSLRIFLNDSMFTNHDVNFDAEMISHIKQKLDEHNINFKKIDLVINHRVILTKELTVPKTDRKKLDFMVTNEMIGMFNLTRDYIVDYTVLGETEFEGNKRVHCLTSAMRKSTIEGLELFFEELGMKINSIQSTSNSFLNFVSKLELVNVYEPVIVVDASSSYIRYYLFNHGHFMFMRSIYIHVDDDPQTITKRVYHVLELMNQSQAGDSGKPISRVLLFGFEKRFALMTKIVASGLQLDSEVPNILDVVTPDDSNLYDFVNCMGVLV